MAESKASEVLAAMLELLAEGKVPTGKTLAERAGVDVTTARRYLSGRRPGGSRSAPEDTETVWSVTSVVRGGADRSQFTANEGRLAEPSEPGHVTAARPVVGPCASGEKPPLVSGDPEPADRPDVPGQGSEFAGDAPVTTETGQRTAGPGPGDSAMYRSRAGRVWVLVVAVEGDLLRVRRGQYGHQVTIAASKVEAWEPGSHRYYSLGGNSATSYRGSGGRRG